MAKFVLTYHGGTGMPEAEAEQQEVMAAWGAWFGGLGESVIDGGNPFAASTTISADGSTADGGSKGLTGYSVIDADGMADATDKAKGCPVLASGGTVEVYEALDM